MSRGTYGMQGFQLPPLSPWSKKLMIGLFGLYVIELTARNILQLPIDGLTWKAFGFGFAPHQLVTRFLIQGDGVIWVVVSGLVLVLLLPTMERLFPRKQLLQALLFGALGGTAMGLLVDIAGLAASGTMGWAPAVTAMIVLFGLAMPNAIVQLFFVFPIKASLIVWGTGLLALLLMLGSPSIATAEHLGTWLGIYGWWHYVGPAARKRKLVRAGKSLERHFHVIEGQKQGDQDDWIH